VLLSTAEAAEMLGISPRRMRALLEEGRVREAKHVGRAWVVPSESLDALRDRKPGRPWPKKRKRKRAAER
jgi:excisionase family DNA binding protein